MQEVDQEGAAASTAAVGPTVTRVAIRLNLGALPQAASGPGPAWQHVKSTALRALRATTPGWTDNDYTDPEQRKVLEDGFRIRALTGGMTNTVFRCSKPGGQNDTVLLRSYGAGTEFFFNRERELKTFKVLGERGFGPSLLAAVDDGRVEEFLSGRALEAQDMRDPRISKLVARKIAALHTLDFPPSAGESISYRAMLERFHRKAHELCGEEFGGLSVSELGRLSRTLQQRLQAAVPSKVVFCHNDLQCGNIMYDEQSVMADSEDVHPSLTKKPAVSLIDYEYAGHNPRAFDIGNHFCEWAADYSTAEPHRLELDKYPSRGERREFCRAYLGAAQGVEEEMLRPEEVESLVREADAYSLASHLLWSMWAVLQAKMNPSHGDVAPFDYLEYGKERLRAYHRFEQDFLPP